MHSDWDSNQGPTCCVTLMKSLWLEFFQWVRVRCPCILVPWSSLYGDVTSTFQKVLQVSAGLYLRHRCLSKWRLWIFNHTIALWFLDQTAFIAACIMSVFHPVKWRTRWVTGEASNYGLYSNKIQHACLWWETSSKGKESAWICLTSWFICMDSHTADKQQEAW